MTKDEERDEKNAGSKLHEAPTVAKETLEDLDATDDQAREVAGGATWTAASEQCYENMTM